ncbi:aldo/keto reductase [Virgisporangium aurantiacum]|uniref:Oxidoreductase n=1 Tax=Virgisporangium aurantiacum TaxID=175570 RepID=A0A8J3ZDG2_9ACTN|nr:aldo/keto reductase [Virgisporangium aurantiacum]GIJ61952.1 oxidoreductase [Virgisporangium aurantiacum]
MEQRILGRTGRSVGVVGLGAWQLGADWGEVTDDAAFAVLRASIGSGVTFVDTADVYGDGRSEKLIERFRADGGFGSAAVTVATKMGRREAQDPANFTLDSFRRWTDRSRQNLGVDTLDLVQLHCPPDPVFDSQRVFDDLDTLVAEKAIAAYGVSVETCDQALRAIVRPGVASVQIILNMLRLKPLERVLPAARSAGVGIIARVPLASGLLSGRYDEHTEFAADDHRNYNRHGEAFDVGETFSGVDYATGLAAVRRLRPLTPDGATTAQFALRWILDQPGVSVVIPGARTADQARTNAAAAALPPLDRSTVDAVAGIYDDLVRPATHDRW